MSRRPPRSTPTDTSFPTRRSSDLSFRRDCVGFDRLHFHGLRCWQTLHMALHILPFRQRGESPSGVAGGGKTQPFGPPAPHLPAVLAAGPPHVAAGLIPLALPLQLRLAVVCPRNVPLPLTTHIPCLHQCSQPSPRL